MRKCVATMLVLGAAVPGYGQTQVAIEVFEKIFGLFSGNARESTQLLNNIELAAQTAQEMKMYLDMVRHGVKVSDIPGADIAADIWALEKAARYGIGISSRLAGEDDKFRRMFPGYQRVSGNYSAAYAKWTETMMDTLSGNWLRVGARNHASILDSMTVLANLRRKALSTDSRLAAMQSAAAAATATTEQLFILNNLVQSNMDAQATFIGLQMQEKATAVANQDQYFNYTPDNSDSGHALVSLK